MEIPSIDPKKQQGFSFLRDVSWSSALPIIISCLALCVSLFAAVVSYNSAQNAVKPLLHIGVGDIQSPTPYFGLFVRNKGMGPARIKSVNIRFDGQLISDIRDAQRIISRAGFPGQPMDFEVLASNIESGMVIGAGQEILLYAGAKDKIVDLRVLESLLKRVHAHIVYSSVAAHDYEVYFPDKKVAGP